MLTELPNASKSLADLMEPIVFESGCVSIVCISDTHNEYPSDHIPIADILIHAGDLTNNGTFEELKAAYDWIASLPHKTKVLVAGNADCGLDPKHSRYSEEAHSLFRSPAAPEAGIHYLDREVRDIAQIRIHDGSLKTLRAYGSPCQPNFSPHEDCFGYRPYPHEAATEAWQTAPVTPDQSDVDIWVMHGPPKDRLDEIPELPMTGCEVLARCIARARPLVAVFGHIHRGYGVEKVTWDLLKDKVSMSEMLSGTSEGREFDLSAPDMLDKDLNTLFVNAAWVTDPKGVSKKRNMPWLIKINFDTARA